MSRRASARIAGELRFFRRIHPATDDVGGLPHLAAEPVGALLTILRQETAPVEP